MKEIKVAVCEEERAEYKTKFYSVLTVYAKRSLQESETELTGRGLNPCEGRPPS